MYVLRMKSYFHESKNYCTLPTSLVYSSMYNKVLTMYASAMSETLPLGKSILHSAHKSPANLD